MAGSWLEQVGRGAPEQVKRRRMLIKDKHRALLQRIFQGRQAEDEPGQVGVLLEDLQGLGGLRLALKIICLI